MKKILLLTSILWGTMNFAQTGINTETPQSTLDVNGDLRVIKELNVGGSLTEKGNPGKEGEVLVSAGKDKAPKWVNLTQSTVPGVLTNVLSTINTEGVFINKGETKMVGKPITLEIKNPSQVLITVTSLPITIGTKTNENSQGSIDIMLGKGSSPSTYEKISSYFWFSFGDPGSSLPRVGSATTFQKMKYLEPGIYTINAQVKVWAGYRSNVNRDISPYVGATSEDKEALATRISVQVFNEIQK